ncbi:MAG: putative glycolipid-binding domain-containing protein, partial [Bacillota bacterium]|nr:putative glycolipid-binding domain-containing protein [Bacillota bacterium]
DRGRGQALLGDGTGRWRHPDGGAAPWLDGCIDVDLSITPATNTLPIRRLRLSPGESRAIQVLYVAFPTLDLRPVEQRYTRLQDDGPCAVYRYESGTFRADLRVDGDGLVLDYPGVWQRRTSP